VRNGTSDIWVSEADGQGARPLTSDAEADTSPAISPDGSRVAFVSTRAGRRGLWLVSAAGGAPRSLGVTDVLDRPAWSEDGRTLLYAALGPSGEAGLWTLPADGGTPQAIPGVTGRCPAWSPRGDLIAVLTSIPPAGPQIRFVDAKGERRLERLEAITSAVNAIAFSWDGRQLAIGNWPGSTQGSIVVLDLQSGLRRTVALLGPASGLRGIAWSADDKRLVYGLVQHESRILLFDGLGRL
jgi:Tol biopolymer transport system component